MNTLEERKLLNDEINSLSPTALIELFELNISSLLTQQEIQEQPNHGVFRFYPGTNELNSELTWQGNVYYPLPIKIDGFALTTSGTLPRPKMQLANINGAFSGLVMRHTDLVGSKLIRKRTFAKYLDSVNFRNGNPDANPNVFFSDDIWYVEQKLNENRYMIEWELVSIFDLNGVLLPRRVMLQNSCPYEYRGPDCGYNIQEATEFWDSNDVPCAPHLDMCGKRLASCELRHKAILNANDKTGIPFGGFPGIVKYENR